MYLCELMQNYIGSGFLFFRYLFVFVAAQMLDPPGERASYIKELTLMCSDSDDCTVHAKLSGVGKRDLDEFLTYGVPVRRARRFLKYKPIDYKYMNDVLYKYGYGLRTRRTFLQNYHGMFEDCCTSHENISDVTNRIEKFVELNKRIYNCKEVVFITYNSYVFRAFHRLASSFLNPNKGSVLCCLNSIHPLIKRSPMYDYSRCVLHMTFPMNYTNSSCDKDPCARAVLKEVYKSNYDTLYSQISLFFNRCADNFFPKKDKILSVVPNVNKTLVLKSDINPELLQEIFDIVMHKKSVCIDVKRDILRVGKF